MRAPVGLGIGLLLAAALVPSAGAQPWQDLGASPDWPWSAPQQPHPSVVRVTVPQRQGVVAFGSGTLVDANDKLGLVITNWHVVDGAAGEITVAFPDGFRSGARILKVDRDWDLAALAISKPAARPVALASQRPQPGDMLTIAGYGQGRYRAASGRCTQYVAPGLNFPYEMIEVAAAARQGDSGGPIFNSAGQLAGVLFGEGGGRTSGSYCRRIHQFLATIPIPAGRLPAMPAAGVTTLPAAGPAAVTPPSQPKADHPIEANPPDQDWSPSGRSIPPAYPPLPPVPLYPPPIAGRPSELVAAGESPSPRATVQPIGMTQESRACSAAAGSADQAAAAPSNRFRDPGQQPEASSTAAADESPWRDWIGRGPLEQIKAALAVVGALALVLHGLRWLRAG